MAEPGPVPARRRLGHDQHAEERARSPAWPSNFKPRPDRDIPSFQTPDQASQSEMVEVGQARLGLDPVRMNSGADHRDRATSWPSDRPAPCCPVAPVVGWPASIGSPRRFPRILAEFGLAMSTATTELGVRRSGRRRTGLAVGLKPGHDQALQPIVGPGAGEAVELRLDDQRGRGGGISIEQADHAQPDCRRPGRTLARRLSASRAWPGLRHRARSIAGIEQDDLSSRLISIIGREPSTAQALATWPPRLGPGLRPPFSPRTSAQHRAACRDRRCAVRAKSKAAAQ